MGNMSRYLWVCWLAGLFPLVAMVTMHDAKQSAGASQHLIDWLPWEPRWGHTAVNDPYLISPAYPHSSQILCSVTILASNSVQIQPPPSTSELTDPVLTLPALSIVQKHPLLSSDISCRPVLWDILLYLAPTNSTKNAKLEVEWNSCPSQLSNSHGSLQN